MVLNCVLFCFSNTCNWTPYPKVTLCFPRRVQWWCKPPGLHLSLTVKGVVVKSSTSPYNCRKSVPNITVMNKSLTTTKLLHVGVRATPSRRSVGVFLATESCNVSKSTAIETGNMDVSSSCMARLVSNRSASPKLLAAPILTKPPPVL